MNKKSLTTLLTTGIVLATVAIVTSNYIQDRAIDNAKIPQDMENSSEFQRWIINLKKHIDIEADEFRLKEKNEVFNAAYMKIQSSDNETALAEHQALLERFATYDDVNFSPNDFQFLDFRHETRELNSKGEPYQPNEVYYHALQEDKIIDTLILSCREDANCYFDRAFFVDNHVFVVSEFSRPIDKKDLEAGNYEECAFDEVCTYTIKLHMFDLLNSAQFVYESKPYDLNLAEMVGYF